MEKEKFTLIQEHLDKIIKDISDIEKSYRKIDSLNITQYNACVNKGRSLVSKQDKILTTELYHILGMGNLTVGQQARFLKKIKSISSKRSIVKLIASLALVTVPKNLKEESSYDCTELGVVVKSK